LPILKTQAYNRPVKSRALIAVLVTLLPWSSVYPSIKDALEDLAIRI